MYNWKILDIFLWYRIPKTIWDIPFEILKIIVLVFSTYIKTCILKPKVEGPLTQNLNHKSLFTSFSLNIIMNSCLKKQ